MSKVAQHLKSSASLLESLEAIKNYRAYITIALGGFVGLMVFVMFAFIASKLAMNGNLGMATVIGGMGGLLGSVIYCVGFLATGILLMDQAKGNEIRSVGSALFAGLVVLPGMIGLLLLLGLVVVAVVIVLAILLFVCKIPGIGPVLYAFVFPVSVVVMGALFFAYVNLILPLSLPAILDGNGVMQVIAKLFALVRTSLLPAIIYQILLMLIVGLTALVSFGMLAYGFFPVAGLSAMILPSGGISELGGMLGGMMMGGMGGMGGEGSGYLLAGGFGGAIVLMLAAATPLLTLVMGNCIIYLNFMRDQDTGQFEENMRSKMDDLKKKAAETRSQLAQQSVAIKQPAGQSAPACAKCGQPVSDDEVFCGNCGNKLK
ncbi:MAG: zinc ribbon domain-containing protein [Gallionella sp.]|nr:zinc ribbon domain-containing protein [Gallionella sp.]